MRVTNKKRGPAPKPPDVQGNVCCQSVGTEHRFDCKVAPLKKRGPGPFLPTYDPPTEFLRCCGGTQVHRVYCTVPAPVELRAPIPHITRTHGS